MLIWILLPMQSTTPLCGIGLPGFIHAKLCTKHGTGGKPVTDQTMTVFVDVPISPYITWQYRFDKSGIPDGLNEEDMIGSTLWLGITEPDSERIKDGTLLVFKDNIIDGNILWAIELSPDFIFDGIAEFHHDGNSWEFTDETSEDETLGPIYRKFIGVTDSFKLGK